MKPVKNEKNRVIHGYSFSAGTCSKTDIFKIGLGTFCWYEDISSNTWQGCADGGRGGVSPPNGHETAKKLVIKQIL